MKSQTKKILLLGKYCEKKNILVDISAVEKPENIEKFFSILPQENFFRTEDMVVHVFQPSNVVPIFPYFENSYHKLKLDIY